MHIKPETTHVAILQTFTSLGDIKGMRTILNILQAKKLFLAISRPKIAGESMAAHLFLAVNSGKWFGKGPELVEPKVTGTVHSMYV